MQERLPGAQEVVRSPNLLWPQCHWQNCPTPTQPRALGGSDAVEDCLWPFWLKSWEKRRAPWGRPRRVHACGSADTTSVFSEEGLGKISARLAKSLGLPSAGEGQAGTRKPGRPQFPPQVLVRLAAGKGELISELHPKQRWLLEPAEGSSASWGLVLALLLACSSTWDTLFGPLSPDQAFLRGHPPGSQLGTREQGSEHLARL